jgi:glycosyltransferase involved in cell wall biosynthesis
LKPNQIQISVVVCTFNRAGLLTECLSHLATLDFPVAQFEILVVDNASTDETAAVIAEYIKRFPNIVIRYVYEATPGLSHARNRGLREAAGEYVAFIDDDGLAAPEWLTEITLTFQTCQADAVGGEVTLLFREKPPYWLTSRFHGWLSVFHPARSTPYPVSGRPFPVGCNIAFRRQLLLDLGEFDPRLGRKGTALLAGEETALFTLMLQAGKKLFIAPKASVRHIVDRDRMTRRYFSRIQKGLIASRLANYQKLTPGKRRWLLARLIPETIGNFILFILSIPTIRYWFLFYLLFYRSVIKLTVIAKMKRDPDRLSGEPA